MVGWEPVVATIDVTTSFTDAADLWEPFLAGIGPAGAWVVRQDDGLRSAVRDRLVASTIGERDGSAELPFRALVIGCGARPTST